MSATEQMRQMLDQLMGTAREGSQYDFTDDRVCRSFLLDCCPHDIFASTRMDLGECKKIHDLALRADYEKASKTKDYGYELDAHKTLQEFVSNSDRKIEMSKKRLAESKEELSSEVNEKMSRDHELTEQIGKKLAQAEKEGEQGNIEASLKLMEEVDQLKKEKETLEMEYKNSIPSSNFQKQKLRVCEVCSAYLDIYDNDRRLADHFGGKLHLGYITIREKYDQLKELVDKRRKERSRERRDSPDRSREKRRRDDRYENDRRDNDRRYRDDKKRDRSRSNDRIDRRRSRERSPRYSRR